jgi:serine/threonine-protein kinase
MSASDTDPPEGSTSKLAFPGSVLVGKFRLEEIVGYGGMGSVWKATHLGLGQEIAIKLVSRDFVKSADALRRFDTEAKAAAKIRSRHIPQVFDNGVLDDGTPYLAMELLQGETLFRRVHVSGPLPLNEAVSVLEQCCRALGRAHSLGIVHRDIKPDNIYLATSNDDDGYVVKVLDFGIAKVQTLAENEHLSTRTGQLLGTPMYMSPEQARGLRTIDHRTDLYSLGLVAHVMLTGNLAFSSESLGDLLVQICTQPLPSLRAQAPYLPPAMEDWFQKACARDADQRYQSAQAFVEGLRLAAGMTVGDRFSAVGPTSAETSGILRPQTTPMPVMTPMPGSMNRTMPMQQGNSSISTTGGTSIEGIPTKTKGKGMALIFAIAGVALAAGVVGVTLVSRHHGDQPSPPAQAASANAGPAPADTGAVNAAATTATATAATIAPLPDPQVGVAAAAAAESASTKAVAGPGPAPHHTANVATGAPPKNKPAGGAAAPPKGIDLGY